MPYQQPGNCFSLSANQIWSPVRGLSQILRQGSRWLTGQLSSWWRFRCFLLLWWSYPTQFTVTPAPQGSSPASDALVGFVVCWFPRIYFPVLWFDRLFFSVPFRVDQFADPCSSSARPTEPSVSLTGQRVAQRNYERSQECESSNGDSIWTLGRRSLRSVWRGYRKLPSLTLHNQSDKLLSTLRSWLLVWGL